ncbi:unnamed protein product [Symbiodinium necroappetens]|uniref:Uncharacterized protein n=1 Tax=Symbiodinium necroappetens TaxID=1628268 RepID=A0A812ZZ85_9DINO|nr:unnamed protein product [Symbiodinium necroappetens]
MLSHHYGTLPRTPPTDDSRFSPSAGSRSVSKLSRCSVGAIQGPVALSRHSCATFQKATMVWCLWPARASFSWQRKNWMTILGDLRFGATSSLHCRTWRHKWDKATWHLRLF